MNEHPDGNPKILSQPDELYVFNDCDDNQLLLVTFHDCRVKLPLKYSRDNPKMKLRLTKYQEG